MIEQIYNCTKCGLCFNQKPLLDEERKCQVFWVGLSAKRKESDLEKPLSPQTNTGDLIYRIEKHCSDIVTYKTNLVKCLPLTEEQKLRYPNRKEMDSCFDNLIKEIQIMSPKIVFLLGKEVSGTVSKHLKVKFEDWNGFDYFYKEQNGIYYVPVHHPSYISVYRRKQVDEYMEGIEKILEKILKR